MNRLKLLLWENVKDRLYTLLRDLAIRHLALHATGPASAPEWERAVYPPHATLQLPPGKNRALFSNEPLFDSLIREAAKTFDLPVHLLKAIIAAESGFRPNVIKDEPHIDAPRYGIRSVKNGGAGDRSYGLVQILLSTARDRGFTGDGTDLLVPRTNVMVGAKHLRWLRDRYNSTDNVIASYNAGSPRFSSPGVFVNQTYVDRVKGFARRFRESEGAHMVLASLAPIAIAVGVYLLIRGRLTG